MGLFGRAAAGADIPAKLASLARHATQARVAFLLELLGCVCAFVLAVTLWAITRDEDPDLAMWILVCRAGEGVVGVVSIEGMLGRIWLATASGADAPSAASASALGPALFELPDKAIGAFLFALGSAAFAYLLLRGRMIPAALAWIGMAASILLVVCLPLELAGFLTGPMAMIMWLPMLAFEVPLGLLWLVKGAPAPARRPA
jgi:hypothetical protein